MEDVLEGKILALSFKYQLELVILKKSEVYIPGSKVKSIMKRLQKVDLLEGWSL